MRLQRAMAELLAGLRGHAEPTDEDQAHAEAIVAQGWSPLPPEISRDRIAKAAQHMQDLMRQRAFPWSPEDALASALRQLGVWVQGDAHDW